MSQLISLSPSSPFRFSSPCIPASILFLPSSTPFPSSSHFPPQAQPLLRYSQSHLQSDIFSGLITLSSHSLIEHVTFTPHLPRPRCAPCSPTPTRGPLNAFFFFCAQSFLFPKSTTAVVPRPPTSIIRALTVSFL